MLQLVSEHVGLDGNEVADVLAKERIHQPQPKHTVSYKEANTLLKMSFRDWKGENEGYSPDLDHIQSLNRRGKTVVFRLMTGHCMQPEQVHEKNGPCVYSIMPK